MLPLQDSEEEREKETQLLYDFYTLSGFRLTCGLVTGMEADHVLFELLSLYTFVFSCDSSRSPFSIG